VTPRQYELILTLSQRWSLYVPAAMFILMPFVFLMFFQMMPEYERVESGVPPFFPWFPFGLFTLWGVLWMWPAISLPRNIAISKDNVLRFTSPLAKVEVPVADILSIEPKSLR
jgi:protein-S-isoprenylcysteine O-methyltransferase Ste14